MWSLNVIISVIIKCNYVNVCVCVRVCCPKKKQRNTRYDFSMAILSIIRDLRNVDAVSVQIL